MTKARKAKPKPKTKPAAISPELADRVLLILVSGCPDGQIAAAVEGLGLAPEQVPVAIAAARRRLTIAADYHREHEIGKAYTRLNDCYGRSLALEDTKTALASQKELNRLLALYPQPQAATPAGNDRDAAELAAVREHLEPLGLAGPDTPLDELARMLVGRLVELEAQAAANSPA